MHQCFKFIFWKKSLYVSDSFSVLHQEFFTVHTAMVYVIRVCWQLAGRIRTVPSWSFSQAVSKPLWRIPLLCVRWKTPDDGQRNCPKHVVLFQKQIWEISASILFYYKNLSRCTVIWTSNIYKHTNIKLIIAQTV